MPSYSITIAPSGESYRCLDSCTLLEGMETLGKKIIPVGCRNGGCGVCKVQIESGQYQKRVMSREHISAAEEAQGYVLSCCVRPRSDVRLRIVGAKVR